MIYISAMILPSLTLSLRSPPHSTPSPPTYIILSPHDSLHSAHSALSPCLPQRTPFVCILSMGSDPTDLIMGLAKKKKKDVRCATQSPSVYTSAP